MMSYLVSTTTHTINGDQIDAWEGDEIAGATSKEVAIKEAADWEATLLKSNGATDINIEGDTIYYTSEDGERLYKKLYADKVERL